VGRGRKDRFHRRRESSTSLGNPVMMSKGRGERRAHSAGTPSVVLLWEKRRSSSSVGDVFRASLTIFKKKGEIRALGKGGSIVCMRKVTVSFEGRTIHFLTA